MNGQVKTVAVCGASGFIGTNLCTYIKNVGYDVVPLPRRLFGDDAGAELREAVASCDAVINVAGATINHRWCHRYKRLLYDSRVGIVRRLVAAIRDTGSVRTFVSASAVGYYPSVGCYDEESTAAGNDFLAGLCRAWEAEVQKAPTGVRTLITRFGAVMAPRGGAFEAMSRPARMGAGTIIGSGLQPFTWIDIDDLCRAMVFLLESEFSGVFNFTAPQKLSQRDAARLVARHYGAKITFRIPGLFFRLLWGEAADFLLEGQCVEPARLLAAGFPFRTPDFQHFLDRLKK